MDFSKKFKEKLRTERQRSSEPQAFETALFAATPWPFETPKKPSEKPVETKGRATSEKVEVLNSLKDFTQKRLNADKQKMHFPGGTLQLKDTAEKSKQIFTAFADPASYLSQLEPCESCPRELCQSRPRHFWKEAGTSPLEVLFVGDFFRDEDSLWGGPAIDQLFARMVQAMKLKSYGVSMLAKCLPVIEERASEMISLCEKHFYAEVLLWRPQVVISFGAFATHALLKVNKRLAQIHGQFFDKSLYSSPDQSFQFKIMPLFHPEYLSINPKMKKVAWEDLQKVMHYLSRD